MSSAPIAAPEAKRHVATVAPWRRAVRPYLLVLPAIALTIGILYPFVVGVTYSFQNYRANRPGHRWVGFDNFHRILTDPDSFHSAFVTAQFALSATAIETVVGIGVALLLARSTYVSRALEKLLIMPLMIAPVIAAIIWRLMMLPSVGVLNYLLEPIGLGHREWTGSAGSALFSIILVDVWTYTPFVALLVLAGLRSLPRAPFEAAAVEGAGFWYTFRNLTLPMLWPYILVAVIFRFMDSLKIFDIVQVLTAGGPGDATMTLQVKAFEEAITFSRYSLGQTYMFILWALVYIATRGLIVVLGRAQARAAGI